MIKALKTLMAKVNGCGCSAACRCGADCLCKVGRPCGAACGCAK